MGLHDVVDAMRAVATAVLSGLPELRKGCIDARAPSENTDVGFALDLAIAPRAILENEANVYCLCRRNRYEPNAINAPASAPKTSAQNRPW